jgi:hypothetical protein
VLFVNFIIDSLSINYEIHHSSFIIHHYFGKDMSIDTSLESEYWKGIQTVRIKMFHSTAQAYVYAAAFAQAQVPHFLSNENSSALMFPPILAQGIGLHVRVQDQKRAITLLKRLDEQESYEPEEDFREADLAEIRYQQGLHAARQRTKMPPTWWMWLLIAGAIIALIILLNRIVLF